LVTTVNGAAAQHPLGELAGLAAQPDRVVVIQAEVAGLVAHAVWKGVLLVSAAST
jgi:hypothetical protein